MLSGVLLLLSLIGLCRFCGWGEEGVMKIVVSSLTVAEEREITLDSAVFITFVDKESLTMF